MRATFVSMGISLMVCACGAASALGGSALIKAPIEKKCSQYGLKGCPELVDGVILYVEGDEGAATQKMRRAASKNVPEEVQRLAQVIAATVPGEAGAEIAAILTGEVLSGDGASQPEPRNDASEDDGSPTAQPSPRTLARLEHVQLALSAQADPLRLTTESVTPLRNPDKASCEVGGSGAVCVRLEVGPLVVTDAMTPPGCATELVIGATDASGRFGWIAHTNAPGFHGARYFVRPSQWVIVAARNMPLDDEGDDRCYVTWAAFKPRMVPPNL